MATETIADIVREMREYNDTPPPRRAWIDLADRIEAAARRDVEDTQGLVEDNRQLAVDLDAMKAENERLRAALKQVLDYDIDTHPCDGYCVMLNDVREAKRIVKEGEAK